MTIKYRAVFLLISIVVILSVALSAQEGSDQRRQPVSVAGWSTFLRGGAVHQFDTGMADGGNFSATRFSIQAGPGYAWNFRTSVSLALGYNYDGYSFSGGRGLAAFDPWENIHTINLGLPIRWAVAENWSAFLIPSVRYTGEGGASFEDSMTGGGFVGVAYRFSKRLTIGPGIGVVTQIEDDAEVFPILIINWNITDRLKLETGRGLGATLGPGLALNYKANRNWSFAIGGRYERLRFRLDERGKVPNGIGEDRAFPLFAGVTYSFKPFTDISLLGGIELGGEMRLEDKGGNLIDKETYDPGGVRGLTFNVRM